MKMKHNQTNEIFEVIGYCQKPQGGIKAICLADARLHPERKGRGINEATVQMEVPSHCLIPIETPNWEEVEKLYSPCVFERIRKAKVEEYTKSIKSTAIGIYQQELHKLIQDGVAEDMAEVLARKKEAEFIEGKLNPPKKEEPKRETKW